MDNIKDIIGQVIGKISAKEINTDERLHRAWQNILEKDELKHTVLQGVKDKKVSILVDSPAWLYQMRLKKGKLVEKLKDIIPDIENISFKIGKIK